MSVPEAIGILAAGVVAGMINVVVGSGTLITFPVLLGFGYSPLVANVTNSVGLVPGSVAGAIGYRRELRGQRRRAVPLLLVSLAGSIAGAALLLTLPASAFADIVPGFIGAALVLILLQSRLTRWLARRRAPRDTPGVWTTSGVLASGVYGGYFGAAQGILLLAILGLGLDDDLQRTNALKVVLTGLVNFVAGVVFIAAARIDLAAALLIALGSTVGGTIGARAGRRLPAAWLRALIVAVGVAAIVRLLTQ